ncbi:hypothetical protein HK102_006274, partial [Quaeritorhiza haematococci]
RHFRPWDPESKPFSNGEVHMNTSLHPSFATESTKAALSLLVMSNTTTASTPSSGEADAMKGLFLLHSQGPSLATPHSLATSCYFSASPAPAPACPHDMSANSNGSMKVRYDRSRSATPSLASCSSTPSVWSSEIDESGEAGSQTYPLSAAFAMEMATASTLTTNRSCKAERNPNVPLLESTRKRKRNNPDEHAEPKKKMKKLESKAQTPVPHTPETLAPKKKKANSKASDEGPRRV